MRRERFHPTVALICFVSLAVASRASLAQTMKELADETPVAELAGERWASLSFKISVPNDQTRLVITTRGTAAARDSGVTLFAKNGTPPTTTSCDIRSGLVGNNERIAIDAPAAGDWYLLLYATTAYGGVTLLADYDDTPPAPPPSPVLTAASVFSDHMVLQRNQPVPVWGTAKPGDAITVTLIPKAAAPIQSAPINPAATASAKADAKGKWRVELAAMQASAEPLEMRITSAAGDPAIVMSDVLVGEVWVASGQSNMEWPMYKCTDGAADIAAADDAQLRLLTVPLGVSTSGPRAEMPLQYNGSPSKWKLCTPSSVHNFSGVAYYFARDLRRALGVPVGVIYQAIGGTTCRAWSPRSAFAGDPVVEKYLADWEARIKNWSAQWGSDPAADINRPMVLYDAMIAPLQPYAIQGVIWYQGESDSGDPLNFRHLFPSLIKNWRREWGGREFPFLFVQVAPHNGWTPELREAQLQTWQTVPQTAMVVTTDVGPDDPKDFHPPIKKPIGVRLVLAARALVYGEKLEYSGPVYESCAAENGRMIVRFTHRTGGLKPGDGKPLRGFAIAGADGAFVDAEAVIEGDTVVVSSPAVPTPSAVRYGWANVPNCNLANGEGLPASPFRGNVLPKQ